MCVCLLSPVPPFATPWTVAHRLLGPRDFPDQNTGMSCRFLLQGVFPIQGSNTSSSASLALAGAFFTTSATWEAPVFIVNIYEARSTVKYHYSPPCGAVSIPRRRSTIMAGEQREGPWHQQECPGGEVSGAQWVCFQKAGHETPQEPVVLKCSVAKGERPESDSVPALQAA